VPLCPPQIPYGLTRDRTRASAVGSRRKPLDLVWLRTKLLWNYVDASTFISDVNCTFMYRKIHLNLIWSITLCA
jgi:hypothetical protein